LFSALPLRWIRFNRQTTIVSAAIPMPPAANAPSASAGAVRRFGRFQLLRLLGKSAGTMLWLVDDPRVNQELMLALPRLQCADDAALAHWRDAARRANRVQHPGLAHAVEVGEHERWPFITYDRGNSVTLAERMSSRGLPAADVVPWLVQVLQGMAFAHEAGVGHHDIQPHLLCLADTGDCRLMGLGVMAAPASAGGGLQAQRQAAERDVLALGLVLHHALAGQPALEQADTGEVIKHMPPLGREIVRLPWSSTQPIAEPLRAITNRATDRQERQRYRSARTFERALSGWQRTTGDAGGGPIALLLDRLRTVGLLPAMPGGASRASQLAKMERERINELAEMVLADVGLSLEMLRAVNSAGVRGAMGAGNGPILTIRRAIAMVGLDGVRRAAHALRPWPGPLNEADAALLAQQLAQASHAGRVAQWLRPPGYDAELVHLLALLQRVGRLVVQYHFPDDATQIRRLMRPAPAAKLGEPDDPGMGEEAAAFAVLGVDLDALGTAIGRFWGLDEPVLMMMRRLPMATPVRASDSDTDLLRSTASCANEVVDAQALPEHERSVALHRVVQRYGRQLNIGWREVQQAALDIAPDGDDGHEPPHPTPGPGPQPHGSAV
jgi:HD-like signal output (HDOD) protein